MNNSSGRILPFTNTEIFSMVFTIFLWTAIILCLTLIPVHITEPQKDYETIHISLNSVPEKKVEEASLGKPIAKADKDEPGVPPVQKAAEQPKTAEPPKAVETPKAVEQPKPAAKTVEQPKAAKTETKPASKTEPKPAPKTETKTVAKTEPAPAPKTEPKPQQLVKSMEELMAEQSRAAPKKTVDDDSDAWEEMFKDDDGWSTTNDSKTPAKTSVSNAPQQQSSFSGSSAAAADSGTNTNASAVSSSGSERDTGVSENTLRQLAGMKSYSGKTGGVTGNISVDAAERVGNGGKEIHIKMSGGAMRRLLSPASPFIDLGDTASQIDSAKEVEIRFTVLAGGTVPYSSIKVTPGSVLPPDVNRRIQDQLSRWRFEPAESDGQATFSYTIIRQ